MYAVFGVTETACEFKAARLVERGKHYKSSQVDDDGDNVCFYTKPEITEAMFGEIKPLKLSPIYSNKSEAELYKELTLRQVRSRDLIIKKRVHSLDENDEPLKDPKTGRVKYSWEKA